MNDIHLKKISPVFGEIRIEGTEKKPLFCAIDVARALKYANPAKAVIDHCKGVTVLGTPTNGGVQKVKFIDEGNLYRLILKSNAPEAEKFQDWVTDEVLPSIRQDGGYIAMAEEESDEDLMARALIVARATLKRREERIKKLEEDNKKALEDNQRMKPKEQYFDNLVDRNLLTNFTDVAKQIHKKRKEFIELLIRDGYVFRDKKKVLKPYAQYNGTLFELKDWGNEKAAGNQTLITPKGKETFRLLYGEKH